MKKFILSAIALICACCLFSSCNEEDSGGQLNPGSMVDPMILGSWLVTKYEAFDKQSNLLRTATDEQVIKSTYWRFDFTADSMMSAWYGDYTSAAAYVGFYYGDGLLYFGDTGLAVVETLDSNNLIFTSDSFMPVGWETDGTIAEVRTTCTKKPE